MQRSVPGAVAAAGAVLIAHACIAQEAPIRIGLDKERAIGGLQVACTGIGQEKNDPRWAAFPIRVEFSNLKREYLSDGAVAVLDASGRRMAAVSCEGPWILLRPSEPGRYGVEGWLPGTAVKPLHGVFHIPYKGQMRLILQFPDA